MFDHPIEIELLRRLLSYEPETGKLTWIARTVDMFEEGKHTAAHTCAKWNSKNAGNMAFTTESNGRLEGRIFGRAYRAHRVAFAISYGWWPEEVDHRNRCGTDNRLTNLRECSHHQNMMNQSSTKGSSSKFIGVSWSNDREKWCAMISPKGRAIPLGRYNSEIAAANAYDTAAKEYFGAFAHLNFPKGLTQ
jgi:hypothetical protein